MASIPTASPESEGAPEGRPEIQATHRVSATAAGPLGYHFGTWGAKGTRLGCCSFHAHCTGGMLELNFSAGRLCTITQAGERLLMQAETGKATQYETAHFLDCIESGDTPLTDGPGSLQGLRVIWRLYEAERKGVVANLRGLGLDEPWDIPGLAKLPA